jgi:hypothetical protein
MELNENTIKSAYKLMEMITKGYQWYHDTPEQPFKYSEGSIWLINSDTKEWMIELGKSGDLWYDYKTPDTFSMYLNMEVSDFEPFIKIWVEDALKRGVVSTACSLFVPSALVEDALKRGVSSTISEWEGIQRHQGVKDAVEKGTVITVKLGEWSQVGVGDVIKNGNIIKNQEI